MPRKKSNTAESMSLIEKLQSMPVPSSKVEFQGETFTVLHTLPSNTMNLILQLVTRNVFAYSSESALEYSPFARSIVWDYCKVRYLTNIPLPEDMSANDVYDLVHRTGIIACIESAIPRDFLTFMESKINEAIEAKKYMLEQETNILNVLQTIIKNMPTPEMVNQMAEGVKNLDFSNLNILTPQES